MIIYRPHRGGSCYDMSEAKEFQNEDDMKKYIVDYWDNYFSVDDIVIDNCVSNDTRIGWKDLRYVCTNKFGKQDNIKEYGCPQCIGYCATIYPKMS